jgi:formate dehydrogenase major subunit
MNDFPEVTAPSPPADPADADATSFDPGPLSRRRWLQLTAGGAVGLALDGVIDVGAVRAATKDVKLAKVTEVTTSCNFCSCGCGMIASVREGKLIALEGDFDHVVNRGSLCAKGLSMFPTHASPLRNKVPRYRAAGSDHWEEITWDAAIDKIAQKLRQTRDESWIATEEVGGVEVPVNRTDAIAFMGGAQNTTEECYLFQKAMRLLGLGYVEHQARL